MQSPPALPLRLREIRSWEDWDAARAPWTELLLRVPTANPYQLWEWSNGVLRADPGVQPRVAVVENATGKWLALAPLCLRPGRLPGMAVMEVISGKVSNYLDAIIDPAAREPCEQLIRDWLLQQRDWNGFRSRYQAVTDAGWLPRIPKVVNSSEVCPYAALPGDIETYEKGLESWLRNQVLRNRRTLIKAKRLEFQQPGSAAEMREQLPVLFRLHQERHIALGEKGHFADPRWCELFTEMAAGMMPLGAARLAIVHIDGQAAAAQFHLRLHGVEHAFLSGINGQFGKLSPGNLVIHWLISQAIQDGVREMDFGRGPEGYKRIFGRETRQVHDVLLHRSAALLGLWHGLELGNYRARRSSFLKKAHAVLTGKPLPKKPSSKQAPP
jgi:CelD/BcsL family acetyltransferase involved in cellulose biosynthesis